MPEAQIIEFKFLTAHAVREGHFEDILTLRIPPNLSVEIIDNAILRLLDFIAMVAYDQGGLGDADYIQSEIARAGERIAELAALRVRQAAGQKTGLETIWAKTGWIEFKGGALDYPVTILVPVGKYPGILRAIWLQLVYAFLSRSFSLLRGPLLRSPKFKTVTGMPYHDADVEKIMATRKRT